MQHVEIPQHAVEAPAVHSMQVVGITPNSPAVERPRIVLICHAEDGLNRQGLAAWLSSFADVVGIVEIRETGGRFWQRLKREVRRVGWLRFLDVVAFRLFYKVCLARRDAAWEGQTVADLAIRYGTVPAHVPVLTVSSPNAAEVVAFVTHHQPTFMLARCKTLLKEQVFSIPTKGTWVLHPGICPQYRNAHGCFWALASDDAANVGLTLLRIDRGIDTGPVFGYFRPAFDPLAQSHIVIQHKAATDNLPAIQAAILNIHAGQAKPISTAGLPSATWGQPWLTAYWNYVRRYRRAPISNALYTSVATSCEPHLSESSSSTGPHHADRLALS